MTTVALCAGIALTAAFLAAGLVVGSAYFAALRRTVDLYAAGRRPLVVMALTLIRIGGVIAFFGAAVRFGAVPLLAAFLGFLVARSLALRAVRGTA